MTVSQVSTDTNQQRHPQQKRKLGDLSPKILRSQRLALKISQCALSRLSGVSRPKICFFELSDAGAALTADEQRRIRQALQREAQRLRNITTNFELETAAATVAASVEV